DGWPDGARRRVLRLEHDVLRRLGPSPRDCDTSGTGIWRRGGRVIGLDRIGSSGVDWWIGRRARGLGALRRPPDFHAELAIVQSGCLCFLRYTASGGCRTTLVRWHRRAWWHLARYPCCASSDCAGLTRVVAAV